MKLKTIREKVPMTQQELADAIGKDRSLIAKIENENSLPSVETAKAIGKVLNIEWTLFFDKVGERNSLNYKNT